MTALLVSGSAALLLGLSATVYNFATSGGGFIGGLLSLYERRLERHTSFLLLNLRGSDVARAQVIVVVLCASLFLLTLVPAFLVAALVIAVVPPFILWKRHLARIAKLERQLDAWLLMLANALKTTSSVGEAIASTSTLVPKPFSEEVDLIVKELRLGVPLDRALTHSGRRMRSASVSGALMMIIVARQTGGDLASTLEQAAAALRESARLEGVLRTKTAEGRGQVVVLSLAPFVLCVAIAWLDGSWFDPLVGHAYGRGILVACASAWLIAAVWAHHIVGAEV